MNTKIFWILVVVNIFFALPHDSVYGKKWTITVKNYSFTPYNLTHVKALDTIMWVWESGNHSTTSTSIPGDAMDWDYPINQDTSSFIYIPTANGTYFYQSTPDTASGMTGHFVVTGGSAISDEAMIVFRVFPNPGSGLFTICMPSGYTGSSNLEIFNNKGEMVYFEQIFVESFRQTRNFDLGTIPRGVYILKLSSFGKKTHIQRVILQ